jgi:hypothetical protein
MQVSTKYHDRLWRVANDPHPYPSPGSCQFSPVMDPAGGGEVSLGGTGRLCRPVPPRTSTPLSPFTIEGENP